MPRNLQTYEAPLEEIPRRHASPAVIVGVAYDEARKYEKEIDRKITVIQNLFTRSGRVCFKQMERDDYHSRHAAESVENFKSRF